MLGLGEAKVSGCAAGIGPGRVAHHPEFVDKLFGGLGINGELFTHDFINSLVGLEKVLLCHLIDLNDARVGLRAVLDLHIYQVVVLKPVGGNVVLPITNAERVF